MDEGDPRDDKVKTECAESLGQKSLGWATRLQQFINPTTALEGLESSFFTEYPRNLSQDNLERFGAGALAIFLPLLPELVMLGWIFIGLVVPFAVLRVPSLANTWLQLFHFGLFACTFKRCLIFLHTRCEALCIRILLRGFSRWETLSEVQPTSFSTGMTLRMFVQLDRMHSKPLLIRSNVTGVLRNLVERQAASSKAVPNATDAVTRRSAASCLRQKLALLFASTIEKQVAKIEDAQKTPQRPHWHGNANDETSMAAEEINRAERGSISCALDTRSAWRGCSTWFRSLLRTCALGSLCLKHHVVVATVFGIAFLVVSPMHLPGSTLATEAGTQLLILSIIVGVFTRLTAPSKAHGQVVSQFIGVVAIVLLSFQHMRLVLSVVASLIGWPVIIVSVGVTVALLWATVRVFYLPGRILLYAVQTVVGLVLLQDLSSLVHEIASAADSDALLGMKRLAELKVVAGVAILAKMLEDLLKDVKVLFQKTEEAAVELFSSHLRGPSK
jgi:hypothetical protein